MKPLLSRYKRLQFNHLTSSDTGSTQLVLTLIIVLVLGLVEAGCSKKEETVSKGGHLFLKSGIEVGNLAPNFLIKNLKGDESALSKYRGKVVLINFWATWCGPCRAEMPSMEALYQTYARKDFEILAISIDMVEDAPIQEFIDGLSLTFPVLLDKELKVNNLYQVRVVPTSILVDRKGIISHRLLGAKDWFDPDAMLFVENLIKADI